MFFSSARVTIEIVIVYTLYKSYRNVNNMAISQHLNRI